MKKLLVFALGITVLGHCKLFAQGASVLQNSVEVNVAGLFIKNVVAGYSRVLGARTTAGISLGYRFSGKIPFNESLAERVDDAVAKQVLNDMNASYTSISPELRFYFGSRPLSGFYVAPFVRYGHYSGNVTYHFTATYDGYSLAEDVPVKARLNTFTGGALLGYRFLLNRQLYVDWTVAGPNYGFADMNMSSDKVVMPEAREQLRADLDEFELIFPFRSKTIRVDDTGEQFDGKLGWGGLRMALNIGLRF